MKLWNPNETPCGGFAYYDPTFEREIRTDGNLDALVRTAGNWYRANGYEIPSNLKAFIEEDICQRQPPGKCRYEAKLGDAIALVIKKAAQAVDKVLKTELERKASRCGGCGKRRRALNNTKTLVNER